MGSIANIKKPLFKDLVASFREAQEAWAEGCIPEWIYLANDSRCSIIL